MFDFLKELMAHEDTKILFILTLIIFAMIVDFLLGTISAKVNPNIDFISKKGINGILRKMGSVVTLVFFIPFSVILPADSGVAMLYTMYLGYLFFEVKSILENLEKMGVQIQMFKEFLGSIFPNNKKE